MTMPLRVTPITRSFSGNPLTPLERVLSNSANRGDCYGGRTQITGGLEYMAHNIESAFVLVEKGDIPKATTTMRSMHQRTFHFKGDFFPLSAIPSVTAEQARKTAAKWLSISQFLEAEEKIEAKKKADAERAVKVARAKELDRIATLHFGKPISELSTNKTSAIEAIYDLEQKLADQKDAA